MIGRALAVFTLSAALGAMLAQRARATICDTTGISPGVRMLVFERVTHDGILDGPKERAEAEAWEERGAARFRSASFQGHTLTWDDGTFAELL